MIPMVVNTGRLVLKIENESKAQEVLNLYLRNREIFEQFEPTRPSNFYSSEYHRQSLSREYKMFTQGSFVRYYIYSTTNSSRIIGAVNFNLMRDSKLHYTDPNFFNMYKDSPYTFAEIGYKLDLLYQGQGLAYEACKASIDIVAEEFNLNRFDARIHPDNQPSIKLATRLNFKPLCFEPQSANIMGKNVDLIRYSLNTSSTQ